MPLPLRPLLISLLLGLLTSLAVAWTIPFLTTADRGPLFIAQGPATSTAVIFNVETFGRIRPGHRWHYVMASHYIADINWSIQVSSIKQPASKWLPRWARPHLEILTLDPPAPDATWDSGFTRRDLVATGWPAFCMLSRPKFRFLASPQPFGNESWTASDGIVLTPLPPPASHEPRIVPLRPILSGLALNTLFYAAFIFILLSTPQALRSLRARRARAKHLCPHCRYDLRGLPPTSPCPECGNPPNNPPAP